MAPKPRLWNAANTRGALGLGDIRGSSPETDWYRATSLKEETPDYDVGQFTTIVNPHLSSDTRHDRSSGWSVKGGVQIPGLVTLEASYEGAVLDVFQRITIEELDIRHSGFYRALNQVVKKQSAKSDMVLPRASWNPFASDRLKMRVLATQAYYAEKRELYVADCKGATISISSAALGAGVAAASGGISALSLIPTVDLKIEQTNVRVSGTSSVEGERSLVAYALQPFVCKESDDEACWELVNVEHKFVEPPASHVSPLEWMWA